MSDVRISETPAVAGVSSAGGSMWDLRSLADCLLATPKGAPVNEGLARDLARAALDADERIIQAALAANALSTTPSPFANRSAVEAFTENLVRATAREILAILDGTASATGSSAATELEALGGGRCV